MNSVLYHHYMSSQSSTGNTPTEPGATSSSETIDLALIERRKLIRPIPAPLAIERNDDEIWAQWSEAITYN